MSSINLSKERVMFSLKLLPALGLLAALAGCATAPEHLSADYGQALKQDIAAQIADPDAVYAGDPAPGSDGSRVGLAQARYKTGTVIAPVAVASKIGASGAAQAQ
jgi:hypothetical protein